MAFYYLLCLLLYFILFYLLLLGLGPITLFRPKKRPISGPKEGLIQAQSGPMSSCSRLKSVRPKMGLVFSPAMANCQPNSQARPTEPKAGPLFASCFSFFSVPCPASTRDTACRKSFVYSSKIASKNDFEIGRAHV